MKTVLYNNKICFDYTKNPSSHELTEICKNLTKFLNIRKLNRINIIVFNRHASDKIMVFRVNLTMKYDTLENFLTSKTTHKQTVL